MITKAKTQKQIADGLEFGLTDDPSRFEAANQYRVQAAADGWTMKAGCDPEPVESYAHLIRDGFKMHILSRDNLEIYYPGSYWRYQCEVNIWGPDRLAIKPPDVYDWEAIKAGARTCNECGATDVDTQRYSFAGRCCANCRPEMAKQYEKPGWTR